MISNGLYLNNVWICDVSCVLTFQGFDLTRPDARTASYSSEFQLPDTLVVRDLLEGAEQLDAGGQHPYKQLPAKLIDEGEVVFSGFAEFVSFQGGWKVNLFDSMLSFFDAIQDKKLSSLNLDRYDHTWSLQRITQLAGSPEGVVYPLIDYGGIDGGIVPYDTMCPSVYAKTLIGQICKEAGYRPVGNWLADPLLNALALPFVGSEPKAHGQDWVEARSARVTTPNNRPIVLKSGSPINVLLPLTNDTLGQQGFLQGKLKPYNTARNVYVCSANMRLLVQAQAMFTSIVRFGAADIRLILERNGKEVNAAAYSKGGYYDGLDIPETLAFKASIDCLAGDEVSLRLTGSSMTDFSDYAYYFSQVPGDTWANFRPDDKVHLGDTWPVSANLPDMTCKDLVMSVAKFMCAKFDVDDVRKTVGMVPLDDVVDNIPEAVDWSECVDELIEPELTVQIDPYTQKNLCQWKEYEDSTNVGFGDGIIKVDKSPNPTESELFQLPFMACVPSVSTVAGYGAPILIKTRTISVSGESTTVSKNDAAPRLILIEPSRVVKVQTKIMTVDGALVETSVTLTACWWAVRPEGAKTLTNTFSLSFDPVAGQFTEETLIQRYFSALKRALRRPRMLTLSVYLQPSDIARLNLSVPIRLQKVRVGALDINDQYFYLNKLASYRSGCSCNATLITV
ncbi:hypothetical protein [Spirosoma sp. KNUC1025]|uniref:hypothetical protein n=1 Tax=Spirosoma sp. KNUC1025 TaxID=2894082 RepID=UPI0038679FE1|nr:hypothetical protein LN737_04500 [Spirosoma sp. KNUC1025]